MSNFRKQTALIAALAMTATFCFSELPAAAQAIPLPTAPGAAEAAQGLPVQSQPAQSQPAQSQQAARGGGGGGRGRGRGNQQPPPPTLGVDYGLLVLNTPDFTLKLVNDSQTVAGLEPKGAQGFNNNPFDFAPADRVPTRQSDGFNYLGDITLRTRVGTGDWVSMASSTVRHPVIPITNYKAPNGSRGIAADLAPTLPEDSPLQIIRAWYVDDSSRLVLHFDIKNKSTNPVEIGGLGIPLVFNNIITGKNLEQAHEICSFFDPYVGQDAGYLQVTRLNGAGPALLVVPETGTHTPFEAYRVINDGTPRTQTSEGIFEWTVHSKAYAENEWRNAKPWNPPTTVTLQPGQTISHGLRLLVSPEIRDIDKTLIANNRPATVGIPGYILPMDLDAKVFLNGEGRKITAVESEPANAITATAGPATSTGWLAYSLKGNTWGRARLTLTYDDGTKQAIHYYVIKPAAQAVADLGNFLFTKQWYTDSSDPFKRAPSIMTYDRAKNQIVTQDIRVWVAGLGDEGGSSWLSGAMKNFGQPNKAEVDKYAEFIDKVVWGGLQLNEGQFKYGVLKSVFYYDPKDLPDFKYDPSIRWLSPNPTTGVMEPPWTAWSKTAIHDVFQRAYNYPHVVAAYWAMYQLARNHPGLVSNHPWDWYLNQAYETTNFMLTARNERNRPVGYLNTGLMEGDVFVLLLKDLQREGWTEKAASIETGMKRRADQWNAAAFPFGSEMAWDSTGQEEVYAWTTYFGYNDKAKVTIDSILGYMPTVPHWGYNGNARRYWDFAYGGAPGGGIERQLHHYGSGINAIPALAQYRQHPDDFYLLRIGYGGAMGALSNIDQEGFASAAFHSYPQNLRWDAYTGDYAQNFFGHALNAATYIINHPDFGWQAFGGNVKSLSASSVSVQPVDSFRKRIYIAPYGLYLTLDAGTFQSVDIQPASKVVRVTLSPADQFTREARLRIEQPAKIEGVGAYASSTPLKSEREALVVPLTAQATTLELIAK